MIVVVAVAAVAAVVGRGAEGVLGQGRSWM
jgi:hypothetical protein